MYEPFSAAMRCPPQRDNKPPTSRFNKAAQLPRRETSLKLRAIGLGHCAPGVADVNGDQLCRYTM
jgi:hypothetical protein